MSRVVQPDYGAPALLDVALKSVSHAARPERGAVRHAEHQIMVAIVRAEQLAVFSLGGPMACDCGSGRAGEGNPAAVRP